MSGKVTKSVQNTIQNVLYRSYRRVPTLNISARKSISRNSLDLVPQNEMRCCQAFFSGIFGEKRLYPTHYLSKRNFASNESNNKENRSKKKYALNLSVWYSTKFMFYMCFDNSLRYHLGPDFIMGSKDAFFYVSDCLHRKDYEGLSDVMTTELFEKLKKDDMKLPPLDSIDLGLLSLVNINWKMDRQSKIKTLEVLVRYSFFTKPVKIGPFFGMAKEAFTKGSVEGAELHFAHYSFFKNYGETIKDTPWLLKDVIYFPASKRFAVPIKL